MKEHEPNPYAELALLQVDKAKEPMPPKPQPGPQYRSLSFLTFVIQIIYLLLSTLVVYGVATNFSIYREFDEAKKLQAMLEAPPPGTDRSLFWFTVNWRIDSGELVTGADWDLRLAV